MPVWMTAQGRTDMKGVLASVSKKDYVRLMVWQLEKTNRQLLQEYQLTGKYVGHHTIVADMEHLSIKRISNKAGSNNYVFRTERFISNCTSFVPGTHFDSLTSLLLTRK